MIEANLVLRGDDGEPRTTSLIVAERFGKQHKNVLRDIDNLDCADEFAKLNFELCSYDDRGRQAPMVVMTRDGFMFLTMGFTWREAAERKERFIAAFNAMERHAANILVVWDRRQVGSRYQSGCRNPTA